MCKNQPLGSYPQLGNLGLRGHQTRASAFPETQSKRRQLGFWAHTPSFSTPLPSLFLVFPPIYFTSLATSLARRGPLEAVMDGMV